MRRWVFALGWSLLAACSAHAVNHASDTSPTQRAEPTKPLSTQSVYLQHCGICHLDAGQGVPGAFPPLDQRLAAWAQSDKGRKYLASVVANGLYGPIQVEGQQYVGAMPGLRAQLSSTEIAGLLNYVLVEFSGAKAQFTQESIESDLETVGSGPSLPLRPQ